MKNLLNFFSQLFLLIIIRFYFTFNSEKKISEDNSPKAVSESTSSMTILIASPSQDGCLLISLLMIASGFTRGGVFDCTVCCSALILLISGLKSEIFDRTWKQQWSCILMSLLFISYHRFALILTIQAVQQAFRTQPQWKGHFIVILAH